MSKSFANRNTQEWLARTSTGRWELIFVRPQDAPEPLPNSMFNTVTLLHQWTGAARQLYKGLPGRRKYPPQAISFSVDAIAKYVLENQSLTGLEDSHVQVFNLQDTSTVKSSYALTWSALAYIDSPGLQRIRVHFPPDEHGSNDLFFSREFAVFFGRLACASFASQAFTYDSRAKSLYAAARRLEDLQRNDQSGQPPSGAVTGGALPEDEELFLPAARYERELNLRMTPAAVWWINYWNQTIVDNIGRERILAAPWAAIYEMPEGALLLEVTREPLDVARRDHCQKLREVFEAIDLRGVQERFRLQRT